MTKKSADTISIFHDRGIYVPSRTIELFGDIEIETFEKVFKNLHVLDDGNSPINLIINSPGGCVTQGAAIYDAILNCKTFIRGTVYGEASSAASFILQACDERIVTKNSYLMVHYGEEGIGMSHPSNIDSAHRKMKHDREWMERIYLENMRIKKPDTTLQKVRSMLTFDKYLTPEDALELGLIDKIKEE